jgi:hypothetical protein
MVKYSASQSESPVSEREVPALREAHVPSKLPP